MNAKQERAMGKAADEIQERQAAARLEEMDRTTKAWRTFRSEEERGAALDAMTDDERHAFLEAERAARA